MTNMLLGPIKAAFEVLCDDEEGAKETMEEFTKTNPFVAPIRIAVDLIADDEDDAEKTAKAFGGNLENIANATPGVGHVIALGHAIDGDEEKAQQVCSQATRTTAVAVAGVVGSAAGPAGAAALAVETGTLWDMGEAAAGGEVRGIPKLLKAAHDDTPLRPGEVFDGVMAPVRDGTTGMAAAQLFDKIVEAKAKNEARYETQKANDAKLKPLEQKIAEQEGVENPRKLAEDMSRKADILKQKVDDNEPALRENQTGRNRNDYHKSGHVSSTMIDEHGNESTGYSARMTAASGEQRFTGDKSLLEQNQPDVTPVSSRRPLSNCAEHMAYENCPNPSITYSLQINNGIVSTIERCENCAKYSLGNVITDFINGEPVPFALAEVPPPGSYIGGVISGTVLIAIQGKNKEV